MPGHADASTTEIYSHYAPDPTHGAAFAQRAFGDGGVAHPLLDRAQRRTGGCHLRAERVAQFVEREPVQLGAVERLVERLRSLDASNTWPVAGWAKTRSASA